jgi:hypothetical protein
MARASDPHQLLHRTTQHMDTGDWSNKTQPSLIFLVGPFLCASMILIGQRTNLPGPGLVRRKPDAVARLCRRSRWQCGRWRFSTCRRLVPAVVVVQRMSSMLPLELECLPCMPRISYASSVAQPAHGLRMHAHHTGGLDVNARMRGRVARTPRLDHVCSKCETVESREIDPTSGGMVHPLVVLVVLVDEVASEVGVEVASATRTWRDPTAWFATGSCSSCRSNCTSWW